MSKTDDLEDEDMIDKHGRGWHDTDSSREMLDEINAVGIVEYVKTNGWAVVLERGEQDENFFKANLTLSGDRLLHIAVMHGTKQVLENVLKIVGVKGYKVVNNAGNTALHLAAIKGDEKMCEVLIDFIGLRIKNRKRESPLYICASFGHADCFKILLDRALSIYFDRQDILSEICSASYGDTVLHVAIRKRWMALAKIIVDKLPFLLGSKKDKHETPFLSLAKCPDLFKSSCQLGCIGNFVYERISQSSLVEEDTKVETYLWPSTILGLKRTHWISNYLVEKMVEFLVENDKEDIRDVVATAISFGIVEIVDSLLSAFPELISHKDDQQQNLIFVAVKSRRVDLVRSLFKHLSANKLEGETWEMDKNRDNLLHAAARFVEYKPWSSLDFNSQILLETQWFEFIESLTPYCFRYLPNGNNLVAKEVFDESHADLMTKSQKGVKALVGMLLIVGSMITLLSLGTFINIPVAQNSLHYDIYFTGCLVAVSLGLISLFSFAGAGTLSVMASRSYRMISFALLVGISSGYWCCTLILLTIWFGKATSESGEVKIIAVVGLGGVVSSVIYLAAFQMVPFLTILKGLLWTLH